MDIIKKGRDEYELDGAAGSQTGEGVDVRQIRRTSFNFDTVSFYSILLLTCAAPIFFLPLFNVSVDVAKALLLFTLGGAAFFFWLIQRLKDARFVFPRSVLITGLLAIPAAFFVSAVFSPVPSESLTGLGFETGTFASMLALAVVGFLASVFFQSKRAADLLLSAVFLSACLVFLYQVIRFIWLSFGIPGSDVFGALPANLVGKWADVAIIFGLSAILALVKLELSTKDNRRSRLLYFTWGLSIVGLVATNFPLLWYVVGAFALILLVYGMSFGAVPEDGVRERRVPPASFVTVILSLFFILSGNLVTAPLFSFFQIPLETIAPSWKDTYSIAEQTIAERPAVGAGANRFSVVWQEKKTPLVNLTPLWGVDFGAGAGLLPTFAITTGIVGIAAFLFFLVSFLYAGATSIFSPAGVRGREVLRTAMFFGASYLWLIAIVYVPNITILILAFVFSGAFIASLAEGKHIINYRLSFLEDPRVGFVSMLLLIVLIMSSVAAGYVMFQKFMSILYYQEGRAFAAAGDFLAAEKKITDAIRLNQRDEYLRFLSEVNVAELAGVVRSMDPKSETARVNVQGVAQIAVENALRATVLDPEDYTNWMTLGGVYQALLPIGESKQLHEEARVAYEKARERAPHHPGIILAFARLEIATGDVARAKEYILEALRMKNNYTEAVFLLSQIQAQEGDLSEAIASAEIASLISPNDAGIFLQIGLLKYEKKDYRGSVTAFERAYALNPAHANTKYFLGLAYVKIGEDERALDLFRDLEKTNPDNAEVKRMIRVLSGGTNSGSAGEEDPLRKGTDLPIKEDDDPRTAS